jgi:FtsP/CotA-like multicopper oxidase with cupredoxin domain
VASVGDRIIVHFRNELPEPTTIHWHGVRVPNAMDGVPSVQAPIPPGGTFDYEFTALDAGTFWYHPHIRSDVQVERGLYGAIVVLDPNEPEVVAVADETLVLGDVYLNPETGRLEDRMDLRVAMMGREGNLVLVNGQRSNLRVEATPGEVRRWRVVNASNARYFLLHLDNGGMARIGGDAGLLEAPIRISAPPPNEHDHGAPQPAPADRLLLTPGERAEVLVWIEATASEAVLRAMPYERAAGAGATEAVDLVRLTACDGCAAAHPPELPETLRPATLPASPSVTRTLRLGERLDGDTVHFTVNGASFPDVAPIEAALGTVEAWDVVNESDMDHPFHLHGFFFQVEGTREWKDSVNIPGETTVRLLVDFSSRDGANGMWMYHCHILGHAEGGMMGEVHVR